MQKDERGGTVAYREGMTRREVFASAAVVGAGIILSPALGSVRQAGAAEVAAGASRTQGIITKTIPRTNESLPARMVRHMDTIPGFDRLAGMPPYPGKTFNGVIRRAQSRRAVRGQMRKWPVGLSPIGPPRITELACGTCPA